MKFTRGDGVSFRCMSLKASRRVREREETQREWTFNILLCEYLRWVTSDRFSSAGGWNTLKVKYLQRVPKRAGLFITLTHEYDHQTTSVQSYKSISMTTFLSPFFRCLICRVGDKTNSSVWSFYLRRLSANKTNLHIRYKHILTSLNQITAVQKVASVAYGWLMKLKFFKSVNKWMNEY